MIKDYENTPANKVIAAFQGVRATARALDRNPSSVSRWRKSREDGGTDCRVPSNLQEKVLLAAQSRGIALTADDLIVTPATS